MRPTVRVLAVAAALALLSAAPVSASYVSIPLPERIARADRIVRGHIVEVHAATYALEIAAAYKGAPGAAGEVILIERFRDWTCAMRGKAYEVGEHLIAFLAEGANAADAYRTLGAGCEGEARIADGEVTLLFSKRSASGHLAFATSWRLADVEAALSALAAVVPTPIDDDAAVTPPRDQVDVFALSTNPLLREVAQQMAADR